MTNKLFDFMPDTNRVKDGFVPDATLLLHPSLPPALHGTNPRTVLKKKKPGWWDKVRKEAYAKHDYRCWACGSHKYDEGSFGRDVLDAHEYYNIDFTSCIITLHKIVALCPQCHAFIHINMMSKLYDKGELDEQDCWLIVNHGIRTMENQSINPTKVPPVYNVEDWNKWHLIIDGESYYSKFSGVDEWREFYDRP